MARAYVLRVVSEFQAFARDLHDLAAAMLVERSGVHPQFQSLLTGAATKGRGIDRGNADVRTLQGDFRRLGLSSLNGRMGTAQPRWQATDKNTYGDLIELRNSLAHGNASQLAELRTRGVLDTVSWARQRLPSLNLEARALDRVVWDHLRQTVRADPWK